MICRRCSVLIPPGSNFCPRCGTPAAEMQTFAVSENAAALGTPPAPPAQRRIGRIILLVVLIPVVLMVTCTGALVGGLFYAMRSSEPYEHALRQARAHPQLRQALGEPIEADWWISGSIETSGDGGKAQLTIPISGPKGTARIYVDAVERNGKWEYNQLQAGVAGQDLSVDLREPVIKLQ